ncbi:Hypothetical protein NocV09_02300170 [Nannochloropsis oceanica]
MEAQLLKFKRLLTMSRERLEENQRQLSDKNQTIDRLTREVDTIKSKLSRSQTQTTEQTQAAAAAIAALKQLQQQQQQQQHQKNQQQKHQQQRQQRERGEEKMGDPPVAVEVPPRRALLRVQQDNLIWVLFEKDEPPKGSSSSSSNSSNGDKHHSLGLAWKSFACEEDLAGHIARGPGQEPLLLPSPCLSPQQSTRLSLEAQGRVDQLQEELRKYRVRSELAIRQKDAEIKHLSAAALAAQQHKIDNEAPDEEELKRTVKQQADKIQALKTELNEQEGKWRVQYQQLQKEKEALEGAGAETALAAQWRKRYESLVKQQQQQQGRHDEGQGGHRLSLSGSGPVEERYNELKEEYRLYRKKALEALKEKDSLISILDKESGGGGGGGGGGARWDGGRGVSVGGGLEGGILVYLKNLTEKYFSTESGEIREHTERAMCAVLGFKEEEVKRMKALRAGGKA